MQTTPPPPPQVEPRKEIRYRLYFLGDVLLWHDQNDTKRLHFESFDIEKDMYNFKDATTGVSVEMTRHIETKAYSSKTRGGEKFLSDGTTVYVVESNVTVDDVDKDESFRQLKAYKAQFDAFMKKHCVVDANGHASYGVLNRAFDIAHNADPAPECMGNYIYKDRQYYCRLYHRTHLLLVSYCDENNIPIFFQEDCVYGIRLKDIVTSYAHTF